MWFSFQLITFVLSMSKESLNIIICILILCFFSTPVLSQEKEEERRVIQFSGVIISSDSLEPVPFASIMVRNSHRGTISDYYGYFSFVAQELDTIEFTSIGYKKGTFIIPDGLEDQRYSIIQRLESDTVQLEEAVVYPWPTREQFKEAFLNVDPPDDDLERAKKNLASSELAERAEAMPMDGSMNFKYSMQQKQTRLYHSGQYPSVSLFNPLAWQKFIKAWKDGDFKKEKDKYDEDY